MKSVPQYSVSMARNQGFSLVVGLIMLSLMTMLAVTTYIVGTNQTVMVANAQHRTEGLDAAQSAIAIVINSGNFAKNPAAAIPASNCGSGANSWCVDSNGDGARDYTVSLTPQPRCITAALIPVDQLEFVGVNDVGCTGGTESTSFGIIGVDGRSASETSGNSLCANSTWEITAQSVDTVTETTVTVIQGLASLDHKDNVDTNCP